MNSDAIQLPDVPGIHGLRFRHFRGGEDYRHMSTIIRVSAEVDDTQRADTPEELETSFAHLTNCDPFTDMIFAEVDSDDDREPDPEPEVPQLDSPRRPVWGVQRVQFHDVHHDLYGLLGQRPESPAVG